ncbi:GTPase IMAP family member 9-like [Conger conger]|uniref:GTPase IMAP family member 9-like n=1 Tax=Conger conger TaxID=82655 RepID=UPI002A59D57E|nr:GTPase IMAP family member 9-like [Conger conger]
MECDCKPDSACTSTSPCGELDDVVADLWLNSKSVLTGTLTVVGFVVYRFSQALPFLIRWPIRIFCSLTGLSSLWAWVSRLLSTVRGLKTLVKWLSSLWKFIAALPTKLSWVTPIIKAIAGSFTNIKKFLETLRDLVQRLRGHSKGKNPEIEQSKGPASESSLATLTPGPPDTGLRIILVGPRGGGRSQLGDTLLGCRGFPRVSRTCVSQRAFVEGREVTVVDTPDLLGSSLGAAERAREALRSIQLAGPGPHAFLLVMRAPESSGVGDIDEAEALKTLLELVGEEALSHVLPVLTHADSLGGSPKLAQLLQGARQSLMATLSTCGQRAELVADGPACPPPERTAQGTRLLERVEEMKTLGGHYVHELQRREDRIREKLREDMAAVLERRLEVKDKGV